MDPDQLYVAEHISSDMFQNHGCMPTHEDDQHVFYGALIRGESWNGTYWSELTKYIEAGVINPHRMHWFVLSRPEPDAKKRLDAIKEELEQVWKATQ